MFVCVTTCIYGAYSGILVFGFRHLYSNISLLRVVWMDRFMSVKTTKGRRRGYGVIYGYRGNAMCIQQLDQMMMV